MNSEDRADELEQQKDDDDQNDKADNPIDDVTERHWSSEIDG